MRVLRATATSVEVKPYESDKIIVRLARGAKNGRYRAEIQSIYYADPSDGQPRLPRAMREQVRRLASTEMLIKTIEEGPLLPDDFYRTLTQVRVRKYTEGIEWEKAAWRTVEERNGDWDSERKIAAFTQVNTALGWEASRKANWMPHPFHENRQRYEDRLQTAQSLETGAVHQTEQDAFWRQFFANKYLRQFEAWIMQRQRNGDPADD